MSKIKRKVKKKISKTVKSRLIRHVLSTAAFSVISAALYLVFNKSTLIVVMIMLLLIAFLGVLILRMLYARNLEGHSLPWFLSPFRILLNWRYQTDDTETHQATYHSEVDLRKSISDLEHTLNGLRKTIIDQQKAIQSQQQTIDDLQMTLLSFMIKSKSPIPKEAILQAAENAALIAIEKEKGRMTAEIVVELEKLYRDLGVEVETLHELLTSLKSESSYLAEVKHSQNEEHGSESVISAVQESSEEFVLDWNRIEQKRQNSKLATERLMKTMDCAYESKIPCKS
jgi:predicted ribosome quality control (RQC) complex YloA/Tae2 family protein